jgi:SAM-dependent methyltransferase
MSETARSLQVHPSNREQARAWDGDEGAYWAAHAERFDQAVAAYQRPFLDAARVASSDHVLDVGCGTGQTTRDAARLASAGVALGVDLSSRMIALARRLAEAEGVTNARFDQADAQIYPFEPAAFDVAISRTGAMFFGEPVAAFRNIARALRPAGRLCLLVWQPLVANEWIREIATALAGGRQLPAPPPEAPGPFSLSDPGRARAVLAAAQFAYIAIDGLQVPFYWGPDAAAAYETVLGLAGWMMEGLDEAGRARALEALRTSLEAHAGQGGVTYDSAAWLITATRR